MKRLLCLLLSGAALSATAAPTRTATFEVKNMTCATCPLTVRQVLKRQPGVLDAKVDLKTESALVTFDAARPAGAVRARGQRGRLSGPGAPVTQAILDSTITCPRCGAAHRERMPTDACQFFYECRACGALLRPRAGDCCVCCSYGDVKCPPLQLAATCCDSGPGRPAR